MTAPTALAIVGVGKIARDQHLPSIARNPAFALIAAASRHARVDGVENFATAGEMLDAMPQIAAVALCMPPQARHAIAADALRRGKHVLLEKPPGATLSEIEDLRRIADAEGVSLFATWHSRFAPGVEPARQWLAGKTIRSVRIDWMEDVHHWHPGQDWIWEPGGLGVFDPGINALSILTRILPPVWLTGAELSFPENRAAPIAARLAFRGSSDMTAEAVFDWRQTGPQTWDIAVETDGASLVLSGGGASLAIDGRVVSQAPEAEYDGIYARFAGLIAARQSDVDIAPLRHVADAFMLGRRTIVAPFHDQPGDTH
jgi:D-galactose 1-dehydrogenase